VTISLATVRHNEDMMRVALWSVRVTGLAAIGLLTFLSPLPTRAGTVTQAVAYAVLCAGVAAWGLAEFSSRIPATARRPLLTTALAVVTVAGCLGASAGGNGAFAIVFAASALLYAAEELDVPTVLALALAGVLATEVGGVIFGEGIGTFLGFPLVLAVGMLMGRNRATLRVQAEQARQLLAQHEQLRAEQRRADVLEERTRIAREIHDVLAHSLGALGIQIQTVKALFTVHNDPERALEALAAAQRMAADGLTDTRRAVQALRSDALPLHDAVAQASAEAAERHRVPVDFSVSGTAVRLPPEATVALLRIAQESLVNAVKHAPGAPISVGLSYRDDGVTLTVANPLAVLTDNSVVRLRTLDSGYGLTGMRERLLLLRGNLTAGQHDGQWVVTAEFPFSAPQPVPPTQETDR
jgi:signal transduction histidine kinase